MSNESEVRGLWSVIIFIWMTAGGAEGAGAHLSHPRVTVHCLAAAVMSTRLLLSVGDGTSKNKCYLSLSVRDDRKGERREPGSASPTRRPLENERNDERKDRSGVGGAQNVGIIVMIDFILAERGHIQTTLIIFHLCARCV